MADEKHSYELTFIVSGVLNQDRTQKAVQRVKNRINDHGGEVFDTDEIGSQRLAYQIQGKRTGFYMTIYFRAPGTLIPRLERQLTIDDDILRYLTLRMDAKMQRHYRAQTQQEAETTAEEDEEA